MATAYPADAHLWTEDPELLRAPDAGPEEQRAPSVPPVPPLPPPADQSPHASPPSPSPPAPPTYSPSQVYTPAYAEQYVYSHDPHQASPFIPPPDDAHPPPPTDEATTAAAVAAAHAANISAELQGLNTGDPWPLLPGEDDALAALLKRRHARARNNSVPQSHTVAIMDTIRTSGWLFLMARGEPENLRFVESALWVESLFTRHPELSVCMAPLSGSDQATAPDGDASQLALQSASYALAIAAAATGQPGAPVKRGPGRPKRPIPPPDPNPPPKRPRGRPRKIRPPPEPKIPKKRGRPPKNRPKETDAEKAEADKAFAESAADLAALAAASKSAQRGATPQSTLPKTDPQPLEPETQADRDAHANATALAAAFSSVLQDQIQSQQDPQPEDLAHLPRDEYNLTDEGQSQGSSRQLEQAGPASPLPAAEAQQ